MKNVRYSSILRTALLCTALVAANAFAEEKVDNDTPGEIGVANCDLTGYKSEVQVLNPPVAIPDNNASGVIVGPIIVPDDGTLIGDVVIDLKATHTWVGDLIVVVGYDETCDGAVDAQSTLLCRPRGTGTTTPAPCGTGTGFGCSGNLSCNETYLWDDTATAGLAEGVCPSALPGGCFHPSSVGGTPLAVFENLRKGGCWYLLVADRAGGDLGTICEWSVHILNQPPIATEQASWGNVKSLFQ